MNTGNTMALRGQTGKSPTLHGYVGGLLEFSHQGWVE